MICTTVISVTLTPIVILYMVGITTDESVFLNISIAIRRSEIGGCKIGT